MKKSIIYITALMLAAAGFSSCDDDKVLPPMPVPGEDLVKPDPTSTILELKEAYINSSSSGDSFSFATEIGKKADDSDYIIKGVVVSSDKEGNIYKNLMIEDATAGLTIALDLGDYYQKYKVGQELTVNVTGLYIGNYGNCMQLGVAPSGTRKQPGRIPEEEFAARAYAYGFPHAVEPEVVTVEQVNAIQPGTDEFLAMSSRLVEFKDMEFENAGEPLAVKGSSTSRYAMDANGNRIQLYNSGLSKIWTKILPGGKGNIIGILSFYNKEWQILINSYSDLQGFNGSTAPMEEILTESFATSVGVFTIEDVDLAGLTRVWSNDSRYSCMKASGYVSNVNHACSSRLVSPEIDLTDYTTVKASYEQACNFFQSLEAAKAEALFEVQAEGGEWEALTVPGFTDYASWTFKSSGNIDLSKYAGKKIRIAFHYLGSATKSGTWEVKNVKVAGSK